MMIGHIIKNLMAIGNSEFSQTFIIPIDRSVKTVLSVNFHVERNDKLRKKDLLLG